MGFDPIARFLIIFGVIIVSIGLFLLFVGKIPFLGKLPGDITIQRPGSTLFIPITTMILISIILTLIINLVLRK
jgi:hypothetical protein